MMAYLHQLTVSLLPLITILMVIANNRGEAKITSPPPVVPSFLCVGLRGNGEHMFSHFGAIARIVEILGPIGVMSGGSSGTISMFLMESIHSNPLVLVHQEEQLSSSNSISTARNDDTTADGTISNSTRNYSDEQRIARISFFIKSFEGMVDMGLGYLFLPYEIFELLIEALVDAQDIINRLLDTNGIVDRVSAALELSTYLNGYSTELINTFRNDGVFLPSDVSVINPEVIDILVQPFTVNRIEKIRSILHNTKISNEITNISQIIRPGISNWEIFAALVDVVGSYFAGYEPVNLLDVELMLEQCAELSLGLQWPEISVLKTESGYTCGQLFETSVRSYIDARKEFYSEDSPPPSRIYDPIGNENFLSIAQTSGLIEDGVERFQRARTEYISEGILNPQLDVDFDETVVFGYWANDDNVLDSIERNLDAMHSDLKSQKFYSLGSGSWLDAIVRSPAEPGLSRGVETGSDFVSLGGWADLIPAQVLDSTGICETIVLVNHPFQNPFGYNMTKLLGATEDDINALYDLSDNESSWTRALTVADANLCYDYKLDRAVTSRDLFQGSWNAPLTTTNSSMRNLFPEEDNPSAVLEYCSPGFISVGSSEDDQGQSPSNKFELSTDDIGTRGDVDSDSNSGAPATRDLNRRFHPPSSFHAGLYCIYMLALLWLSL